MALQAWDKSLREENAELKEQLMIAGKGGSPYEPYEEPKGPKPNEPYVPAPGRGKLAGLRITPDTIMLPKEPAPAESDDDYGEGEIEGYPGWKLSHGEHFDEYGRRIQDPGFGIDPGGNPIRLPHMEQSPEEQERNKGLHDWKYHDGPDPDVVRGMMIMADAAGLTKHLKGIGQDQRTGTMKKSGLGPDELIRELLIGVEKFKA